MLIILITFVSTSSRGLKEHLLGWRFAVNCCTVALNIKH